MQGMGIRFNTTCLRCEERVGPGYLLCARCTMRKNVLQQLSGVVPPSGYFHLTPAEAKIVVEALEVSA